MDSPQAPSSRRAPENFKPSQAIVRHTLATDQLLEKYRMVSNTLGPGLGAEIPGLQPECLAARSRARRINQVICAAYRSLQRLRSEQTSSLPELTPRQIESLMELDKQILLLRPALSNWFETKFPPSSTIGKSPGDWVQIDHPIRIAVHFRKELDPELRHTWHSPLEWRFAKVLSRLGGTSPGDPHPSFKFQPFCDEEPKIDRSELAYVKSEVLQAVLPRIPAVAFAARFVEAISLEIGDSAFTAAIADMSPRHD
jgi:hypothetical protein